MIRLSGLIDLKELISEEERYYARDLKGKQISVFTSKDNWQKAVSQGGYEEVDREEAEKELAQQKGARPEAPPEEKPKPKMTKIAADPFADKDSETGKDYTRKFMGTDEPVEVDIDYIVRDKGSFFVDREDINTGDTVAEPGQVITFKHKGKTYTGTVDDEGVGRDDDAFKVNIKTDEPEEESDDELVPGKTWYSDDEDKEWSSYEQRMVNQIKVAKKEGRGMYTLPMKTQDFYRKHKDKFDESIIKNIGFKKYVSEIYGISQKKVNKPSIIKKKSKQSLVEQIKKDIDNSSVKKLVNQIIS